MLYILTTESLIYCVELSNILECFAMEELREPIYLGHVNEIVAGTNLGFKEPALLQFLRQYPKAGSILQARSLAFSDRDNDWSFPSLVTREDENSNPELKNQAFRGRVGRHSVAVGMTMNILLDELGKASDSSLEPEIIRFSTEVMILHDIGKLEEILLRGSLGSSDKAYDFAENHSTNLLTEAGYPPEFVLLSSSVGHNGARDFTTAPILWSLIRQAAYISDDLLQETTIQEDIIAKTKRLQTDPRYSELNKTGFPERRYLPRFVDSEGQLRPKFVIQEEATIQMARNIGSGLGRNWHDIGRLLIQEGVKRGVYTAKFATAN